MYRAQQPAAGGALSTDTRTYGFEIPRSKLKHYRKRVIVAGSRGFDDYSLFATGMRDYLERYCIGYEGQVAFITGFAKSGADALVVRWCEECGYPWVRFEARWDDVLAPNAVVRYRRDGVAYNVRAGYERNGEMALAGTNLIVWWDGVSGGTRDMIERAERRNLPVETILITTPAEKVDHGRQPQSRASGDPGVR